VKKPANNINKGILHECIHTNNMAANGLGSDSSIGSKYNDRECNKTPANSAAALKKSRLSKRLYCLDNGNPLTFYM